MSSNRPYLIRALSEWITDNGMTPYIMVDARYPEVEVPGQFVEDGKIVLNISAAAVHGLSLGLDYILFSARFGGRPVNIKIPVQAVLGIYARENGKGMIFPAEESNDPGKTATTPEFKKAKPVLKIVD